MNNNYNPMSEVTEFHPVSNFNKVRKFHETFEHLVAPQPGFPSKDIVDLRVDLIEEELQELKDAIADNDLIEVADALTDILYVVYGAGLCFGVDLDKCFDEVQRSNMSKAGADGKPIKREDGKILKGPDYSEPDLTPFVKVKE